MAPTKRQNRSQEMYYRADPRRVFDSLSDLVKAVMLFEYSTKLKQKLQDHMGRIWNAAAAATFMELDRHCMAFQNVCGENPLEIMRKLGSPIGNWASLSQGNATQFFRGCTEAICDQVLEPGGPLDCHSAAFALWFASQHNPALLSYTKKPTSPTTPTKLLYQAASSGSSEAQEIMKLGWSLMQIYHCAPELWVPSQPAQSQKHYWLGTPGSNETFRIINGKQKEDLRDAGVHELEKKAEAKIPQILALIESLWSEILTTARCGIRAGCQDTYYLQGPWEKLGQAHRFFYEEGVEFPVVGMGISLSYCSEAVWTEQTLTADLLQECRDKGTFCLLSYLGNLIAYHEVVCREPKKASDHPRIDNPSVTPQIVRTSVRDYERTLPEGQRCGAERAEAFFLKYQRELAKGKTYVSAHERGYAPGDRLIEGRSGLPHPRFSVNIEAIIEKM